jgi:GTP-binding protein EngB required for normal cell division
MEEWKFAFQVLQFLLTGGIGVYVYLTNKDKVTNERISTMEKAQTETNLTHSSRLAKLEMRVEQSPTHQDLSNIYTKINQVSDCVSTLEGKFETASHTLNLIHDFLLRGSK